MQAARGLLMAGNNIPVLKLDIDEENIRRLDEISEKFKAAFTIGPGGFPVNNPPPEKKIPGNNNVPQQPKNVPAPTDTGRPRDENGRYLPQGGGTGNPGKGKKPAEDGGGKFLGSLKKFLEEDEKAFTQVSKTLKQVNNQLTSLFKNTISWGVRLSLLSGGGLFGYDMFAAHAAKQYTTSQGLNMTTGQMQAAKNVYGTRFAGIDSTLKGLSDVQNDMRSPTAAGLMFLGVQPGDGAAKNLPLLLQKVYDMTKGMKDSSLAYAMVQSHQLGGLISPAMLNQIMANGDNLPKLARQYDTTSKTLNMSDQSQRSWQDITTKFENNWDSVINTLSTKLASLNGPIGELSTEMKNAINAFISGPNGTAVFNMISDGLTDFADWLASPQFKTDMKTFADDVAYLCQKLKQGLDLLHLLPDSAEDKNTSPDANGDQTKEEGSRGAKAWLTWLMTQKFATPQDAVVGAGKAAWGATGISDRWHAGGWYNYNEERKQDVVQHAQSARVLPPSLISRIPNGLLDAVVNRESGGNPFAISPKGAMGPGQFIPDTARRYGLKGNDVFDPEKVREAMTRYFSDNLTRYHGDIAESLAQYNGGNKAVMKGDILNMKMETVKYLMSILPKVQGGEAQHPQLMQNLANAQQYLSTQPKDARVQIHLEQTPGADVGLSVKSQGVRLPANAFVIPG